MVARRSAALLVTVLTALFASSCGKDDPAGPGGGQTGSIQVTAATSGMDLDDEYTVAVAGADQNLAANGSVTFTGVAVGSQSVQLAGVAGNCTVTGGTNQTVAVADGQTASASFAVVCSPISALDQLLAQALQELEDAMFTALNIGAIGDLDSFSFATAHDLFGQVLGLSPSHDVAAFGQAMTTIFMLEDDSQVRALAEDWEAWLEEDVIVPPLTTLISPASVSWQPMTLPLDLSGVDIQRVAQSGLVAYQLAQGPALSHDPPPSVTEIQAVLGDIVRPALIDAFASLAEITDPSFVFTVTPRMQGELPTNADPLELDYTEVLGLQAGTEVALAAIDVAVAYVLEPNPLGATGLVDAMTPGSTFLTLSTAGATDLADALSRLQSAAGLLLDALDALEAETDDQADDIIKSDPSGNNGLTPADIAEARGVIQDVQAALTGQATVTLNEGTPDEISFALDAREFFVNPIQDFKTLLPSYEVFTAMEEGETVSVFRWTALNLSDWSFPDPTFSGILPGMASTQDLIDNLAIDGIFFELSLTEGYYQLITVDGVDCQTDANSGGPGCQVGTDFYSFGSLDIDGYDGMPQAYVDLGGTTFFFATGTFIVTDNQDGTHEIAMDMEVQDGTNTPLQLTGTFTDMPGYSSVDQFGRRRGGSMIEVSYLGSVWIFEKSF